MPKPDQNQLSRRERQIMDILYERGEAAAADVRSQLPEAPSYSAVRAMLTKLEAKGHIKHHEEGLRYIFKPTLPRHHARRSAMRRLVQTFFDGSHSQAIQAFLGMSGGELTREELDELSQWVQRAKRGER